MLRNLWERGKLYILAYSMAAAAAATPWYFPIGYEWILVGRTG